LTVRKTKAKSQAESQATDGLRTLRLSDLVADPQNRRRHNARNLGMVTAALQEVGAARSVVIDEDNVVLAGNGVTEAALAAGFTRVRVVEAAGDELVAVRRSGLSPSQKRALAIYDNRTAELAEWNPDQLQADLEAGLDLSPWFSETELAKLVPSTVKAGLTDPDDVPAARATSIVLGDVFALGAHRLVCGDCTTPGAVQAVLGPVKPHLMVTDPPYGVDYDPDWRNRAKRAGSMQAYGASSTGVVANDDRSDWREAWALFPGDVAYVWHGALHASKVAESLESAALFVRAQIIWAKQHAPISRGHYHWQHEPCWYAVRKGGTGHWAGDRKQTTLWQIANANAFGGEAKTETTGHGTQKPVECMRRPIENNSSAGQAVYEPFLGSGTTIIAAEQTGRACHAIELDPTYVQMAIDRWEAFTGQKAEKVGALTPEAVVL
jgi:DNA modification methylase